MRLGVLYPYFLGAFDARLFLSVGKQAAQSAVRVRPRVAHVPSSTLMTVLSARAAGTHVYTAEGADPQCESLQDAGR